MNNLRNTLFIQFAIVVFLIIAIFEGALIFFLISSFNMHLKDKLVIIATEISNEQFNKTTLLRIQHKYKVYPLFIRIINKTNPFIMQKDKKNIEGFITKKIDTPTGKETLLIYNYIKNGKIIQVSTVISGNDDKIQIVKTISLAVSLFIYLIVLLIGYKFIDKVANNIEESFRRLKIFNSNVSHELKTPLTIMKGEIEVALMNNECDEELLKSLLNEINYINEITDKLLFLTKKDALNKQNFENIDLEDIILELFEKYTKKVSIDLNIKEDEEYYLKGDKTLLMIAISNLIENSIKYGATKINITLKKEKNKIILKIKDNGIGIPKEKLPFIFDEFYRVDESRNKKVKGFGLGLSIVKSIINLHNGKIKLNSDGKNGVEAIIEFFYQK
ncbi:cell wall metabolism sensor histidine kinase WalK [Nautilia sp. PV-1]|uniref:sensor histidine kinase n=1 Tax=Nautilia sp. PV-1 TaxID=2579250 RepID=UPI001FEE02B7|nr:HAMP domain-containing sensor histidine kinase [Nautilia sp. PV-1]